MGLEILNLVKITRLPALFAHDLLVLGQGAVPSLQVNAPRTPKGQSEIVEAYQRIFVRNSRRAPFHTARHLSKATTTVFVGVCLDSHARSRQSTLDNRPARQRLIR